MWFSTGQIAEMEGVTSQTIRERIESGFYENVKRTQGGHYRVNIQQKRRIAYARVSSAKQTSSIDTQRAILLEKFPDAEFLFDIASAFNFERKSLRKILGWAMRGDSIEVVVTTSDRLARSGFHLIRFIIELCGGQVTVLDETHNTEQQFDVAELVSFITSFCNSHYGKRSAKRRKQKDTILSSERESV